MRAFDAHAIGVCGVPGLVLMENAGRGAADVIERELLGGRASGRRVVVVCGRGNNGGDGLVVARHLALRGALVDVRLVASEAQIVGDARVNLDAWRGTGGPVSSCVAPAELPFLVDALARADVAVDAVFGTGLDREVTGHLRAVLEVLDRGPAPIAALDVASGLGAESGAPLGFALRASLTVAFAGAKLGHATPTGRDHGGALHVVDIGVPCPRLPGLPEAASPSAWMLEASDVSARLRPRSHTTHKYRAGHVAVLAGSPGKTGAALLAAHGAQRAGAGACTIVSWRDAMPALQPRVLEAMTQTLDDDDLERTLDDLLSAKHSVVLGPGLGTDERAGRAVRHVLASCTLPVVLDADALSPFAGRPEELSGARARLVLTPHEGELGRLLGVPSSGIASARYRWVREAADRTGAVVVLKGAFSLVAGPGVATVVCVPAGNPVLATAGSGDVLAGIIAALACGLSPRHAAEVGAWLHGAAGDAWAEERGDRGLLAHEIADAVPGVVQALVGHPRNPG